MTRGFILGNPRSGTSLLRIMLNSHSSVAAPPECGFLQWWHEDYGAWSMEDTRAPSRVRAFVADVLRSRKMETWEINAGMLRETIEHHEPTTYGELCECVYLTWARRSGCEPSVIVDKNNYYLRHTQTLEAVWPDAKYLYIVRDGRDVATSYQKLNNIDTDSPYEPDLPSEIPDIAKEWTENNEIIASFLRKIPCKKSLRIKYEHLVSDTNSCIREICRFLDIQYEQKMENFYKYNDEPEKTIAWKKKTLEELDESRIGKYKERLSSRSVKKFESIARPMLKRLKYTKS